MRTLLLLAGEPLGISTDALNVGDVIKIGSQKSKPVVVNHIIKMPMDTDSEGKMIPKYPVEADQVAYLHIDEKIEKKFTSKKRSSKMEKAMAKTIDGKTTIGSGAFSFNKGDVKSEKWLGEHKFTDADFYSLKSNTWNKIVDEAFGVNKMPIMEIVIGADSMNVRLIVMNTRDFQSETNASEKEFSDAFYFLFLNSKYKSIRLEGCQIQEAFQKVADNLPDKMPAIFLTFDNLSLVGILPQDFQRIFND
jgi:hypothetical protein